MTGGSGTARGERLPLDRERIESFLLGGGTDRMAHPGGTLFAHVRRVAEVVAAWGGDETLQAAALCHACYGTDGFLHPLLPVAERARLVELIGPAAESQVYRYGSCDRGFTYPQFGRGEQVEFRDRFTGRTATPSEAELRAFLELTAANELDVLAYNPGMANQHGAALLGLFTRARGLLTDAAWQACQTQLDPVRASGISG